MISIFLERKMADAAATVVIGVPLLSPRLASVNSKGGCREEDLAAIVQDAREREALESARVVEAAYQQVVAKLRRKRGTCVVATVKAYLLPSKELFAVHAEIRAGIKARFLADHAIEVTSVTVVTSDQPYWCCCLPAACRHQIVANFAVPK